VGRDRPPELARCHDHGLVLLEDGGPHLTFCAACETSADVRLDTRPENPSLTHNEFTGRVTADAVRALVPTVAEYLDDRGEGPVFVSHVPFAGTLPAGYSEQEQFILAVGYEWGTVIKWILTGSMARETIETLTDNGYGGDNGN